VPHLRVLRPGVPGELSDLVAEMLDKDPARRPDGAADIAAQLATIRTRISKHAWARPLRVVVADADQALARAMASVVRRADPYAEVEIVRSAEQALSRVESRAPDALLLGLDLPDMNAVELCMLLAGAGDDGAEACVVGVVADGAGAGDVAVLRRLGAAVLSSAAGALSSGVRALVRDARGRSRRAG
jgi:CheY-like chemotaxis protein